MPEATSTDCEEASTVAKARIDVRKEAAYQALKFAPDPERRPRLEQLYTLARDLRLSDDDFLAQISRVLDAVGTTPEAPAVVAPPPSRHPDRRWGNGGRMPARGLASSRYFV